jgi:hypothetical protein
MAQVATEQQSRASTSATPTRGAIELTVAAASPQTTAGSDFSIFVIVRNPFEVPITLHQVETHIPIELMDMNRARIARARVTTGYPSNGRPGFLRRLYDRLAEHLATRRNLRQMQTGTAIAVGTDFSPSEAKSLFESSITVRGDIHDGASVAGVQLNFPEKPSPEELDRIFNRLVSYEKGIIPVQLQPGDSVVRQFVLRTESWLFFTPLAHTFQIQINYVVDGAEHTATVPYQLTIRSHLVAIAAGAIAGALLGALLKTLTLAGNSTGGLAFTLRSLAVAVLASIAVVIGFSRKAAAQPFISIEDFWGGIVIGFSVGFFGFDQFSDLFSRGGTTK